MMGSDSRFWFLFSGVWLFVGAAFIAASLGVNLFADADTLNKDTPLWVFFAAGIAAAAFGGFILWRTLAAVARDRRLTQFGKQITASVVDIRRSLIDINRQTRWHVVYRYEDGSGRALQGESGALAGEAVQGFRPSDRVNIKVDPQKPEDSLFLGAT